MEVERLVCYNEPADGPISRIQLVFEGDAGADGHEPFAVVLLNETQREFADTFRAHIYDLVGREFVLSDDALGPEKPALAMSVPFQFPQHDPADELAPLSALVLAGSGSKLVIPLVEAPALEGDIGNELVVFGLVITGSQFLRRRVKQASLVPKDVPTPFVADPFGDTYNTSFYREPRVVESAPQTVFSIVEAIMATGTRLFHKGDCVDAGQKYKKAYHYASSYFPEDLAAADDANMVRLKFQALLNLALCALKGGSYHQALDCVATLLEMPEIETDPLTHAKALYRRGSAYLALGDEDAALVALKRSNELHRDPKTEAEMARCAAARRARDSKIGASLRKAFN